MRIAVAREYNKAINALILDIGFVGRPVLDFSLSVVYNTCFTTRVFFGAAMKLMIVGHGRHGKDTLAEMIARWSNLTFQSSSLFAAEKVVMPYLAAKGITYPSVEACFEDRLHHRMEWRKAIEEYNTPDHCRLTRELFDEFDMYVGIRRRAEFIHASRLADLTIWIERPGFRLDPSLDIFRGDCDIAFINNGTEDQLEFKVARWLRVMGLSQMTTS